MSANTLPSEVARVPTMIRETESFLLQTATFAELGLSAKVQAAIEAAGYTDTDPHPSRRPSRSP